MLVDEGHLLWKVMIFPTRSHRKKKKKKFACNFSLCSTFCIMNVSIPAEVAFTHVPSIPRTYCNQTNVSVHIKHAISIHRNVFHLVTPARSAVHKSYANNIKSRSKSDTKGTAYEMNVINNNPYTKISRMSNK